MHIIKVILLATVALAASGPLHAENYPVVNAVSFGQVKAATAEKYFWSSFWDILAGKRRVPSGGLSVKVTDAASGAPLKGAAVMIGWKNGDPFPGNTAVTDADGNATFNSPRSRAEEALPVTVAKSGYSTFTLMGMEENTLELSLQPIPGERDFGFMQGKLTGFPPGYDGGTLELGLFLPGFRPESLVNFDPNLFVSAYQVKIDLYGQRDVPGNVVLPTQSKRWGLIPISLSKPEYIMPLPIGYEAHMSGLVGAVPISDAVSLIQKKDILGVINITNFTNVGWTNDRVKVRGNQRFNLNAGQSLSAATLSTKVSSVPANTDVIAISMFDVDGDRADAVTMDLKAVSSENVKNGSAEMKLGMLKQRRSDDKFYVFTGLFNRHLIKTNASDYTWAVGSGKSFTGRSTPAFRSFLSQMQPQGVSNGNRTYRFSSAASRSGDLNAEWTIVNLVSEKQNDTVKGRVRTLLWSTLVKGPATQVNLPDLGRPVLPSPNSGKEEKFRWEVVALKTRPNPRGQTLDLQEILRNVEHVSSFTKAF